MMLLLDAASKTTVILLATFLALWALRRSSAAMRHLVVTAGLACAALSPALTLVMPGWRIELPAAQLLQPRPAPNVSPAVTTAVAIASPSSAAGVTPLPVAAPFPRLTAADVYAAWIGGTVTALSLLIAGFVRLAWVARHASPASHPAWLHALTRVTLHYRLPRPPRLLQSRHPSLLVTWGLLRPAVLLPVSAPSWNEERMRVVLDHELAHVARRDWAVQIAAELVRCVYWFHPLVWIACRRLRQESEQACDDRVLAMGHAGTAYASHLLDLARVFRASDRMCIPAAAIARPSSLERRVAAMLKTDVNRQPLNARSAVGLVLLLLAAALPVASYEGFAQARFAAVSGVVTDESGAVLVDVTLSVTNSLSKSKYEVRSNQTGFYEFAALPAGEFEFEVRQPGFESVKEPLTVGVGDAVQRNVALRIGHVQETIRIAPGAKPLSASQASAPAPRGPRPCPNPAVGGCIGPPAKLRDVRPIYPPALETSGVQGEVEIEATIGSDGRVTNMRVVSSPHPDFERSALDAVGAWEFAPTTLNGRAVETRMKVRVGFGASPRVP